MTKTSHLDVAFFVPNLIGYARFLLLMCAPYYAFDDDKYLWFVVFYLSSELLDAVDGNAARYFN